MSVYGPGCHPQNIIWTEAKLRSIYYFVGDRPVHKLHFGPKWHELFVILYSILANLSDGMFFVIVYQRPKTSSDKIQMKTYTKINIKTKVLLTSDIGDHSRFCLSCFGSCWLSCSQTLSNYLAFQSFNFERTWWMLFQKRYVHTTLGLLTTSLVSSHYITASDYLFSIFTLHYGFWLPL
jgi:hypothetical protein